MRVAVRVLHSCAFILEVATICKAKIRIARYEWDHVALSHISLNTSHMKSNKVARLNWVTRKAC